MHRFSTNVIQPSSVNELLERALVSIPNPPCNYTKLGLETFLVMPWADYETQVRFETFLVIPWANCNTQGPDGNLPKDTQMVTFMMPRTFELWVFWSFYSDIRKWLAISRQQELVSYGLTDMVANIGGYLGLFIGLSCFAFIDHLCQFAARLFNAASYKKHWMWVLKTQQN